MDVVDENRVGNNGNGRASGPLFLSVRERQVVSGVVRGLTNHEIADELHLSEQTIKNVLSGVYAKLGIHTRVQLATFAVRNGLADA